MQGEEFVLIGEVGGWVEWWIVCAKMSEEIFGGVGVELGEDDGDWFCGAGVLEGEGEVEGVVGKAFVEFVDRPDVHFDGAVGVEP